MGNADRYITVGGRRVPRKTTKGWHLCVQWQDGLTLWERVADLKELNPVGVAEFAKSRCIDHKPAFQWWIPYTLKKRNCILAAVNKRYHKQIHKYGIRVPKTVKKALQIDKENGNTFWQDAIAKEMQAVHIAFRIMDDVEHITPGYKEIECHMIFTVKLE